MARTYSVITDLGSTAPAFDLPTANPGADGRDGDRRALRDFDDATVLVVVFTCNHCPYALHVEDSLITLAREYRGHGVEFVAISSNDPGQYPEDSFESMVERARHKKYPFPYLFDESQEVAKAYGAVCTPDPFVFDARRKLAYHGRVDSTRPGMGESDGSELRAALDELLASGVVTQEQHLSMGCNIKWKPGNAPLVSAGIVPSEATR